MSLAELLKDSGLSCPETALELEISGLTADSREVRKGQLFVALRGEKADGHDFLAAAISRGAVVVVVSSSELLAPELRDQVTVLSAPDGREVLARLAANFYGHPQDRLRLLGVTGTNGKTTTSYLLESIIRASGGEPGVIGTVNYRYRGRVTVGSFTTPEPVALFSLMREMADSGVTHLVMEVSSHALAQSRLTGLAFDLVIFTNLSRDHLDFHSTMTEYFAAKKVLFTEHLKNDGAALVLLADNMGGTESVPDWGARLVKELMATGSFRSWKETASGIPLLTAGRGRGDLRISRAEISLAGIDAGLVLPDGEELAVTSPLTGDFNLENILVAVGGGWLAGIPPVALSRGIADLHRVPGRLEKVENPHGPEQTGCQVFVDYAHTPDALARVLATLRQLTSGRLVLVFGCGGDRDRGKRPLMGEVAGRGADVVLITSDNPRSEAAEAIIAEIERGLYPGGMALLPRGRAEHFLASGGRGFDLIVSRRAAIRTAIRFARPNDVVLLAGKGHEDYQIIGRQRNYFDDRREAALQMAVIKR